MEPREILYEGTEWVTVAEAATRLEVKPQTIQRFLKKYYWVETRFFPDVSSTTLYLDYQRLVMARMWKRHDRASRA